ncbi:MAG: hypothetical protein ACREIA_02975, partial [Opitutaceae bacterium]
RSHRWLVCSGWQYAAWPLLEKHQVHLRKLFEPAPGPDQVARRFLKGVRRRHDLLAGLFVRRGDYQVWTGGRFYFPFESYVRWVRELIDLHPGRRVGVVLAGDETIPCDLFGNLPVFLATGSAGSDGHWFESFLELAGCDFIAAAPSTFAAGAAFLGNRPWWPLRFSDQTLSHDQVFARHLFDAACDPDFALAIK